MLFSSGRPGCLCTVRRGAALGWGAPTRTRLRDFTGMQHGKPSCDVDVPQNERHQRPGNVSRRKGGRQASLLMPCQFEGEGRAPGSEMCFAEGTSCHVRQTQFTTTKGARGLKGGAAGCPPPCFSPAVVPRGPKKLDAALGASRVPRERVRRAAAERAQSRSRHAPSGAPFGLCRYVLLRGRAHGGASPGRGQKAPRLRLLRDRAGLRSACWRPSCESVWQLKIIGKQLSFRSSKNANDPVTTLH